MMKKLFVVILAGFLALSAFAQTGPSTRTAPGTGSAPYTIEVGGSTSVTPLMELLAAEYTKLKPNVKVNINPTGSGDGIKNAGSLYQIGMSSRELTPAEKGAGLKEQIIAIDGIAIIVHKNNPVNNLTVEQIRDIFSGAITDWSQVAGTGRAKQGKIAVISREAGSGTRGAFEEIVGLKTLVAGAAESTSTGAIKAAIAQNPDAIGYISLGSLDKTVKALSVGGAAATNANVVKGSYKIARPFIVLYKDNAHAESKAFLAWMLSKQGQAVVKSSWIPVK
jgi:phosphate transport system substrate-binding protein